MQIELKAVQDSFNGIAADLAAAAEACGEPATIDVGDLADAIYNDLFSGNERWTPGWGGSRKRAPKHDTREAFRQIRAHLATLFNGRKTIHL
jgi:hypothetical protein